MKSLLNRLYGKFASERCTTRLPDSNPAGCHIGPKATGVLMFNNPKPGAKLMYQPRLDLMVTHALTAETLIVRATNAGETESFLFNCELVEP